MRCTRYSLLTSWNPTEVKNLPTWVDYRKQCKSEGAKIIKAGRKKMRESRRGGPHRGCGPRARPLRMEASRLGPPAKGKREATWLMKLNTWYVLLRRTFRDFTRVANVLDIAFTLDLLRYILVKNESWLKYFRHKVTGLFRLLWNILFIFLSNTEGPSLKDGPGKPLHYDNCRD